MKHLLTTAAMAVLVMTTAASAAENIPTRYNSYATPAFSWTGFYVGVNAGYGFGSLDADLLFNGVSVASASAAPAGFVAGAQVGYNYQFGNNVVLGVEADWDKLWQSADVAGATIEYASMGTVRARVGYAFDRWLPYATAGLAYGTGKIEAPGLSQSASRTGWVGGLGVEYAFDRNWSAKVEYLFANLGKETFDYGGGLTEENAYTNKVVRVGVNYRF